MESSRRKFVRTLCVGFGSVLFFPQLSKAVNYSFNNVQLTELEKARILFYKKMFGEAESICINEINANANVKLAYVLLRKINKAQNKDYENLILFHNTLSIYNEQWFTLQYYKNVIAAYKGNKKAFKRFTWEKGLEPEELVLTAQEYVEKNNHILESVNSENFEYYKILSHERLKERVQKLKSKNRRELYFEKEHVNRKHNLNNKQRAYHLAQFAKYKKSREFDKSLETAYQVYNIDKLEKTGFIRLRNELLSRGKTLQAVELYDSLSYETTDFWHRMGLAKTMRQHAEESSEYFWGEKAINEFRSILNDYTGQLSKENEIMININIGICLRVLGRQTEAIDHFQSLYSNASGSNFSNRTDVVLSYAKTLIHYGEKEKAQNMVISALPGSQDKTVNRFLNKYFV